MRPRRRATTLRPEQRLGLLCGSGLLSALVLSQTEQALINVIAFAVVASLVLFTLRDVWPRVSDLYAQEGHRGVIEILAAAVTSPSTRRITAAAVFAAAGLAAYVGIRLFELNGLTFGATAGVVTLLGLQFLRAMRERRGRPVTWDAWLAAVSTLVILLPAIWSLSGPVPAACIGIGIAALYDSVVFVIGLVQMESEKPAAEGASG